MLLCAQRRASAATACLVCAVPNSVVILACVVVEVDEADVGDFLRFFETGGDDSTDASLTLSTSLGPGADAAAAAGPAAGGWRVATIRFQSLRWNF
jgi:hypothetical protein